MTPTPKYIETLKRRVWEIHIRDHDKHIRREDLNAVLAGVDYVLDYYGKLEQVGEVKEAGDHIDVSIDEDLLWSVGEKLYRFRDGAE